MEHDLGDGAAVAAQPVLLGRPRDPLGRAALLAGRAAAVELALRLRQLRLQVHHLHTSHRSAFSRGLRWQSRSTRALITIEDTRPRKSRWGCQ